MRNRFFYSLSVISLISVSGCGYNVAKLPTFDKDRQHDQEAVVVVKINNFDYLDLARLGDHIDSGMQPQEPRKLFNEKSQPTVAGSKQLDLTRQYRVLKANYFLKPFNYAQTLYSIPPGIYYISYMGINSDKATFYTAAPGINNAGEVAYGAFNIKAGDVLYLGDLECQWRSTNTVRKLKRLDNFSEVKEDLERAGYSEIAQKIVKAEFLPSGSNLQALN